MGKPKTQIQHYKKNFNFNITRGMTPDSTQNNSNLVLVLFIFFSLWFWACSRCNTLYDQNSEKLAWHLYGLRKHKTAMVCARYPYLPCSFALYDLCQYPSLCASGPAPFPVCFPSDRNVGVVFIQNWGIIVMCIKTMKVRTSINTSDMYGSHI